MKNFKFNTNQLKYIAIFAMVIDHCAWTFLETGTATASICHFFGRLTAPIMCYFIAQGYRLTHDKAKYALRLFIFAVISQIPWIIFHQFDASNWTLNMIFTLFVCFLAVHVEYTVKNILLRTILIFALCIVTVYSDWMVFSVLFSVYFYRFRDKPIKKYVAFSIVSICYFLLSSSTYDVQYHNMSKGIMMALYCFGTFLAIPLLMNYDVNKPYKKQSKWVFYIFYPAHLMVLAIIKMFL